MSWAFVRCNAHLAEDHVAGLAIDAPGTALLCSTNHMSRPKRVCLKWDDVDVRYGGRPRGADRGAGHSDLPARVGPEREETVKN